MKHFLLFSLLGLVTLLRAQDEPYLPTAVEAANWIIFDSETPHYPYYAFVRSIEGDTVVGERTYKKLYEQTIDFLETQNGPPFTPPYRVLPGRRLIALLRDEVAERKVFGLIASTGPNGTAFSTDTLLHDYSLEVSDTLVGLNFDAGEGALVVTATGTENRFGADRNFQEGTSIRFYQGIGSMEYGPVSGGSDIRTGCCIFQLVDYCVGDFSDCGLVLSPVTELSREVTIKTFPNPFTDQLNIVPSEIRMGSSVTVSLRDITGRKIRQGVLSTGLQWSTGQLPPGVYLATFMSGTRSRTVKLVKLCRG